MHVMHAADAAAETPRLLSRAQPAIPVITNKKDKQINLKKNIKETERRQKGDTKRRHTKETDRQSATTNASRPQERDKRLQGDNTK